MTVIKQETFKKAIVHKLLYSFSQHSKFVSAKYQLPQGAAVLNDSESYFVPFAGSVVRP